MLRWVSHFKVWQSLSDDLRPASRGVRHGRRVRQTRDGAGRDARVTELPRRAPDARSGVHWVYVWCPVCRGMVQCDPTRRVGFGYLQCKK